MGEPWKVLYRSKDYILAPYENYRVCGRCAECGVPVRRALTDADTGRGYASATIVRGYRDGRLHLQLQTS